MKPKPQRWHQLESLFQSALERQPDQRAAFLAEACAGSETLRTEVESLIVSYEKASSFIETPAIDYNAVSLIDDEVDSLAGRRIGPYKLIREIGHGGMGTVCLAVRDDQQYEKLVAVKIVNRGMDTDFILRRFRSERQILASLDHPNIARLHDGGTTEDGLPYFVMEHVEGKPIYEYCDTHEFSTVERLKLFRTVCSAVHYAHQNLVVHRDIKPGNILVTADGAPKLLDFGIAKLLNPELSEQTIEPTATALRLMTPEYASPEQVRGETITTASDIYSLGVLLYELLTGHRPYRLASHTPLEIMRIICEEEPEKPSTAITRIEEVVTDGKSRTTITPESVSKTREGQPEKLRRRLAGDLDNIVMKAMSKEPERRYDSVQQFSEDIRRHLEGLPVIARKDTFRYRSSKFVRRHKAGVIAGGLIVLMLTAGIIATAWEAHVATIQHAKAQRRFNDVRRLANSFMFEIHEAIKPLPGSTPARELLVKRALEYLDSLTQEAGDDPSLQRELATAYLKVGDVQGNPYYANLGDSQGALTSYRKALAIYEALLAPDPTDSQARRGLKDSYAGVGDMLWTTGDTASALENYGKALAISESLWAADPTGTEANRDLGLSYSKLGFVLLKTGDAAGALENYQKALPICEALSAADPTNHSYRRAVATAYFKLGDTFDALGEKEGALRNYHSSLLIFEALSASDPADAHVRYNLALNYGRIGDIFGESGDFAGALKSYREGVGIQEALSAADPSNARVRLGLAQTYSLVGQLLEKNNDLAGNLENQRTAINILQALLITDPKNVEARHSLSYPVEHIADALLKTHDWPGALESYRKALTIVETLATEDPMNAGVCSHLATLCRKLGDGYAASASKAGAPAGKRIEQLAEARTLYQRSLDVYLEMRQRGTLASSSAAKPDEVAREIARCDAALAKLQTPQQSFVSSVANRNNR